MTRSISIALRLPYRDVYRAMADGNAERGRKAHQRKRWTVVDCDGHLAPTIEYMEIAAKPAGKRTARRGIRTRREWFQRWMRERGWVWVPVRRKRTHLGELALPGGRLIVAMGRHYTAVIDGVVRDTFNVLRARRHYVHGYWQEREARERARRVALLADLLAMR